MVKHSKRDASKLRPTTWLSAIDQHGNHTDTRLMMNWWSELSHKSEHTGQSLQPTVLGGKLPQFVIVVLGARPGIKVGRTMKKTELLVLLLRIELCHPQLKQADFFGSGQ